MPILITYIIRAIQFAFQWIVETLASQVPGLSGIYDLMPSSRLLEGLNLTVEIMSLVNYWFPVDFAVLCFTSWCAIAIVVYTINWILGLVPTVS